MAGSDKTSKFHGYTKQSLWDTFIKFTSITLDAFACLGAAN